MSSVTVGRRKKDAERVNYNLNRTIRTAVLRVASENNLNETDAIEYLLQRGLGAEVLISNGKISYAELVKATKQQLAQTASDRTTTEGGEANE